MSWRSSNNSSRYRSRNDEGSAFGGGSAGGPPLFVFVGAALLGGLVMLVVMIASGGRGTSPVAPAPQPTAVPIVAATSAPAAPTAAAAPAAAAGNGSQAADPAGATETINFGPEKAALAFAQKELSLKTDTVVTLNFENINDLGVQHNWVLVGSNTPDTAAAVNAAAAGNAAELFIPPAGTPDALAWTTMVPAGSSASVTFRTPAAGAYLYICTFPGHYAAGMQGVLTVTN